MVGIFSRVIDYMHEEGWAFDIVEGETLLRFHFKGSSGRMQCYADVDEEKQWLTFYSYLPVNAPPPKIRDVAEFVSRANRGMRIGNFELDYDDGEIRYKTSIDIEGGELTPKMIENLLRANLSTMNRYFQGLMEVIYGNGDASELIREIESPEAEGLAGDDAENESDGGAGYRPDDEDESEGGRGFSDR